LRRRGYGYLSYLGNGLKKGRDPRCFDPVIVANQDSQSVFGLVGEAAPDEQETGHRHKKDDAKNGVFFSPGIH